jgi:hypothetical protein
MEHLRLGHLDSVSASFLPSVLEALLTTPSVEAAVIIIACCIPLLQPLVDLIFGRRTLTGSKGYHNYGSSRDGSAHLRSHDIELEKKGGMSSKAMSSKARTDVSRIVGDYDDDLMQTRVETGSQESILQRKSSDQDVKLPMQTNAQLGVPHNTKKAPAPPPKAHEGVIMKTHEVTVSYSKSQSGEDLRRKNWNAV